MEWFENTSKCKHLINERDYKGRLITHSFFSSKFKLNFLKKLLYETKHHCVDEIKWFENTSEHQHLISKRD